MDFRDIVRDAAKRKLVDLAKTCLEIFDELKREDSAKVEKFMSSSREAGCGDVAATVRPFLHLVDEPKKEMLRKRILDKMNELTRELDQ